MRPNNPDHLTWGYCAPAVLREDVEEYFEMRPNEDSPYMLLVAPVRKEKLLQYDEDSVRGLAGMLKQDAVDAVFLTPV